MKADEEEERVKAAGKDVGGKEERVQADGKGVGGEAVGEEEVGSGKGEKCGGVPRTVFMEFKVM